MDRKYIYKSIKLVIIIIIIFIAIYIKKEKAIELDSFQAFISGYGFISIILFLLISSFRTLLFIPTPLLYVAGGMIFGAFLGVLLTTLGVIISTTLLYLLAKRYKEFFNKFTRKSINEKIKNLEERKVVAVIFAMRAIPGIPYDAVSISAGIVGVSLSSLLIGTVLGIMPKAVILGSIGDNLDNLKSPRLMIIYVVLILAVFGIVLFIEKLIPNNTIRAYRKL